MEIVLGSIRQKNGLGVKEFVESGGKKIPVQRRSEMLDFLRWRGAASIQEIASALDVSGSTVRRDLKALEGVVERSHGGAVVVERTTFEPLFEERRLRNAEEKVRIGEYAAGMIEARQSVIFDSSSTVLAAVEAFGLSSVEITAVTNDIHIASVLAEASDVGVVMTGGELRRGSFTLLGPATREFLKRLHVDIAFLGTHAISGGKLSDASLSVVEVKQGMISSAQRVVLLADHGKFGSPAFYEIGGMEIVDDLITDRHAPEEALEEIRESGSIRVHLV